VYNDLSSTPSGMVLGHTTFDIPVFTYEGEKQGRINKIYCIMQYISVNKM
jgi:hypothetical protein